MQPDEELRSEALEQATRFVIAWARKKNILPQTKDVIEISRKFEVYLRNG